jgi:hypothetical protein
VKKPERKLAADKYAKSHAVGTERMSAYDPKNKDAKAEAAKAMSSL